MKSFIKKAFSLVLVAAIMLGLLSISASAYYACNHTEITSRNDSNINTIFSLIDSQAFSSDSSRNSAKDKISYLLYDTKFNPFDRNKFPYLNSNGYTDYVNDGNYKYEVNGAGCFAYCKWASKVVYNGGHGDRLYPTNASGSAVKSVSGLTADIIKNFMMTQCQAGEHIRIDNTHSITFLACNNSGYYYLEYYKDSAPYIRLCYSTYNQFLSALKSAGKCIWVYNANKYVNQGGSTPVVPSTPAVSLSVPTDPTYTAKQFVTETNACLVTQITKPAGSNVTHCGLILMNADGSLIKQHTEDITGVVGKNTTTFHSWYDINKEVGVTLTKGTTYKYRFFAIVDGVTYEGGTYTLVTSGPASYTATLYSGLDYSDSSTITVTQGQAYGYLPGPTLPEGYNFNGWYTAKEGGEQVIETTVFNGSGNISLYARYSIKPIEVTIAPATDASYAAKEYIDETAACLVAAITKTAGSELSEVGMYLMDANDNIIKRGVMDAKGQISNEATLFHVWCDTKDNLGLELQPATTYKYRFFAVVDGKSFDGPVYTFTTNAPATFTAKFYSDLDYSHSSQLTITKGQTFGVLPSPVLPDGYSFLGWFTAKEGGEQVFENTVYNGTENLSLYARYEKIEKPVEVSIAQATDEEYASKHYISENAACLVAEIKKSEGALVSEAGMVLMDKSGAIIKKASMDTRNEISPETTLFHLWCDTNEHLGLELESGNTYKYYFYVIVDGVSYEGDTFSFTTLSPVAFQAKFFSALDYSKTASINVTKGAAYGKLPAAENVEGYEFIGWYTAKTGGELITENSIFNGNENISIYARYKKLLDLDPTPDPDPAPDLTPITNPFVDVKSTDYFYDSVLWAVDNGVTSG
ncbi:MAG: InlB B-repeat-containing protein, partial [Oscillospiraceae bacterium]|nr:InlB B-repeat-containing protein [Oscillospiraceae bacterium]